MLDLLIRGGQACLPGRGMQPVDIGVEEGRIVFIGNHGAPEARREIDARGLVVLPGAIEPHMHYGVYMPYDDDCRTESRCAATGGVTTVLSYFRHGGDYPETVADLIRRGESQVVVDFGLHIGILSTDHIRQMEVLYRRFGISSFKFYTNYVYQVPDLFKVPEEKALRLDDGDLGYVLRHMGRELPSATLCVHCESMEISRSPLFHREWDVLPDKDTLSWYEKRSPDYAETVSALAAALLARKFRAKAYLVHTSAGLTADMLAPFLRDEQTRRFVTVETCPHYLTSTVESEAGLLAKVNPPVRYEQDSERLWEGIREGVVNAIGTDHCNSSFEKKGGRSEQSRVKPGFGGVGLLLPLLISEGYYRRGLSLERIAEVTSSIPASVFGLTHKGRIAEGYDADFALVDLEDEFTVKASELNSASDYSIYEGMRLKGRPVMTVSRGRLVMDHGEICAEPGTGRYVKRV